MAQNTSISLGDYFDNFVSDRANSGKYASVSEVVRSALRLPESEENKSKTLINELIAGEKSGMVKNFNRNENLEKLHAKHAQQ